MLIRKHSAAEDKRICKFAMLAFIFTKEAHEIKRKFHYVYIHRIKELSLVFQ